MGMSGEFMQTVLQAIHEESVRQQIDIFNKRWIYKGMRILILGAGKWGHFSVISCRLNMRSVFSILILNV